MSAVGINNVSVVGDQQKQQLSAGIAETNINPVVTSANVMGLLKLMGDVAKADFTGFDTGQKGTSDAIKGVLASEMKYLSSAFKGIHNEEKLRRMFGSGLSGVTALAGYLANKDAEMSANAIVKDYLPQLNGVASHTRVRGANDANPRPAGRESALMGTAAAIPDDSS